MGMEDDMMMMGGRMEEPPPPPVASKVTNLEKLLPMLERMRERMMRDQLGWLDTYHLERAIDVLTRSQLTLANMQVITYYVSTGTEAEMYKINLNQLEKAVERVSQSLQAVQEKFGEVEKNKKIENKEVAKNKGGNVVQKLRDEAKEKVQGEERAKMLSKKEAERSEWVVEVVDKLNKLRQEIENRTRFCDNRRNALVELIKDGPAHRGWTFD